MAQTWTLESGDAVRRKFDAGSTARHVVACRCDWGVETRRPVHSYFVLVSQAHGRPVGINSYLPHQYPSPFGTQCQCPRALVASDQSETRDNFRKGNNCLLISTVPVVDMDDGLISLRGEDMGYINS